MKEELISIQENQFAPIFLHLLTDDGISMSDSGLVGVQCNCWLSDYSILDHKRSKQGLQHKD
ncbi:hypothetical protein ACRASS_14750 [Bacteroides hominis]|uniref:hypothetical protein n=1 Tax=Bacteroides hominis TaxID=2763023 RepID=UPI003D6B86B8